MARASNRVRHPMVCGTDVTAQATAAATVAAGLAAPLRHLIPGDDAVFLRQHHDLPIPHGGVPPAPSDNTVSPEPIDSK